MTSTAKAPRIGFKMTAAAEYVASHPGCTQQECAIAIGPNGSHAYGSRAVQRALRAGLIYDDGQRRHGYSLRAR
jgi:hypothetical protein